MRAIEIDRPVRGIGAFLVAWVVLAAAGCRPDYAKLEACTPAELVEIMRGGWRVNRGAAGAELSLLAMRKPEIVRPVAEEIRKLLASPHPETRRWATCVLLRIDRFREDVTASARRMLSDKGRDAVATESRSKVLYHLVTNPFVLHECRDLVVQALSDEDNIVVDAAGGCLDKDTESYPLDDDAAVVRVLELCHTNHGGWQSHSLDALSRVTPRLRATVAQGLSTVTVLPGNEKRFAKAVEATSRREDEG
jgi:hypothetical protein